MATPEPPASRAPTPSRASRKAPSKGQRPFCGGGAGQGGGSGAGPFPLRSGPGDKPRDPARRGPRSRSPRLRPLYPAPAGRPPLLGAFRPALLGVGPARLAGGSGVSICKGCARPRIDDCIYKHALGLYSYKPSGLPFVYLLPLSNTAVHFPLPAV